MVMQRSGVVWHWDRLGGGEEQSDIFKKSSSESRGREVLGAER